jgi:hypothetical protein
LIDGVLISSVKMSSVCALAIARSSRVNNSAKVSPFRRTTMAKLLLLARLPSRRHCRQALRTVVSVLFRPRPRSSGLRQWTFDDETFERSATAFENPDFVRISLYNYRWYLGLESGERKYDELEKKIATFLTIARPTITLEGDANGAPHPDPSIYAKKYVGRYEHRTITSGIGHNLPPEAPEAFAKAIVDVNAIDRP